MLNITFLKWMIDKWRSFSSNSFSISLSLSLTHTKALSFSFFPSVKRFICPAEWIYDSNFDTWRVVAETRGSVWWWILYCENREKRKMFGYVKWKAKQVSKIQEIKDVMQIWRLLWIWKIFLKIQEYRTPYGAWSALKDTTQIYAVQYLISFVFFLLCFSSFHYITSKQLFFFFFYKCTKSLLIKKVFGSWLPLTVIG